MNQNNINNYSSLHTQFNQNNCIQDPSNGTTIPEWNSSSSASGSNEFITTTEYHTKDNVCNHNNYCYTNSCSSNSADKYHDLSSIKCLSGK